MTPSERIEEIRARWAAARPGPWRWTGYKTTREVDLMSGHNVVMDFVRWGMSRAQPRFNHRGVLHKAEDLLKGCDPANPDRARITSIPHPDATAIAAAPEDVAFLLKRLAEVELALAPVVAQVRISREVHQGSPTTPIPVTLSTAQGVALLEVVDGIP